MQSSKPSTPHGFSVAISGCGGLNETDPVDSDLSLWYQVGGQFKKD